VIKIAYEQIATWIEQNIALFSLITVWSLAWKGIALWRCGRNKQLVWFIAVLVTNTLGIIPIIYLVFFQKKRK